MIYFEKLLDASQIFSVEKVDTTDRDRYTENDHRLRMVAFDFDDTLATFHLFSFLSNFGVPADKRIKVPLLPETNGIELAFQDATESMIDQYERILAGEKMQLVNEKACLLARLAWTG